MHHSAGVVFLVVGDELLHVFVGLLQLRCPCVGTYGSVCADDVLGNLCRQFEEYVVERHDVGGRTVVCQSRLERQLLRSELLLYVVEQTPVTRTESVDALLYVAHDDVLALFAFVRLRCGVAHALVEQRFEVGPLHDTRVLKLVNHDVLQVCPDFLEDKRRVVLANHLAQERLRVAEHEALHVLVLTVCGVLDEFQQTYVVDVLQGNLCRVVAAVVAAAAFLYFVQQRDEFGFCQIDGGFVLRFVLLAPFRRIVLCVFHAFAHDVVVKHGCGEFEEVVYDA